MGVVRRSRHLSGAEILSMTAKEYGLPVDELKSARRYFRVSEARQKAMYRMAVETELSLPQIGRIIGNRDHTTILHGIRRHAARNNLPDYRSRCL
jgi:chromosomal replication initiator protein